MNGIAISLPRWFSERPQWLQLAATRLLQQSELTDNHASAAGHCKQVFERVMQKFSTDTVTVRSGAHQALPAMQAAHTQRCL